MNLLGDLLLSLSLSHAPFERLILSDGPLLPVLRNSNMLYLHTLHSSRYQAQTEEVSFK